MTQSEYDEWTRITKASEGKWTKDPIHSQQGCLFIYKGGEKGMFIEIDHAGGATFGTYEDAIPHIGEALFRPLHTHQFSSADRARGYLENLGVTM